MKVSGATTGETIDDASRTAVLVVVKLADRALYVAMVVEPLQAAKHLLRATGNEGRKVQGAQEAIAMDGTKQIRVTRSQIHRRKSRRTSKTWVACKGHDFILPAMKLFGKGWLWITGALMAQNQSTPSAGAISIRPRRLCV